MPRDRTKKAFDTYRCGRQSKEISNTARRYDRDTDQMTTADGLEDWRDGPVDWAGVSLVSHSLPDNLDTAPEKRRLWVVTEQSVLHAPELCAFGYCRDAKAVKHSNLTGGGKAYSGGELVVYDQETIIVNGCSGRYGVQDDTEMTAVAQAFKWSGYKVWRMPWDEDTQFTARLGTLDPIWVGEP